MFCKKSVRRTRLPKINFLNLQKKFAPITQFAPIFNLKRGNDSFYVENRFSLKWKKSKIYKSEEWLNVIRLQYIFVLF